MIELRTEQGRHAVRRACCVAGALALVMLAPAQVAAASGWSIQPVAPEKTTGTAALYGISCFAATNCTAVGTFGAVSYAQKAWSAHWDGARWSPLSAPSPIALDAGLSGVSCRSATTCIAVGSSTGNSGATHTLAERRDGTSWTIQTGPGSAIAGWLSGISCESSTSCIAVGATGHGPLAEAFNGKRWSTLSTPQPGYSTGYLTGISCPSAVRCTAVGYSVDGAGHATTLAERWDGSSWKIQKTADPRGASSVRLTAVSCPSAAVCMAVGYVASATYTGRLVAESWNGRGWQLQSTAKAQTPAELSGVSCASPSQCIAVGSQTPRDAATDGATLAESWNGKRWRLQSTPNPPSPDPPRSLPIGLAGVSCLTPTLCTAVGEQDLPVDGYLPLAERYTSAGGRR